jgi:uncharacterized protein (DUF58 family)
MLSIKLKIIQLIARWFEKRNPRALTVSLGHKNVLVFSTKTGFIYVLLMIALFIAGVNYKSAYVLSMSYLVFSISLVSLYLAFKNLYGLSFEIIGFSPCYSGEMIKVKFKMQGLKSWQYERIQFSIAGETSKILLKEIDYFRPEKESDVIEFEIPFPADSRGHFFCPPICIKSLFPLGLICAWSWLYFIRSGVVYPKPVPWLTQKNTSTDQDSDFFEGKPSFQQIQEEWQDLKIYEITDSPNRINWKHFGKTREYKINTYASMESKIPVWLMLENTPGRNIEEKLGVLANRVIQLSESHESFGLILKKDQIIPIYSGISHMHECLTRLALYE